MEPTLAPGPAAGRAPRARLFVAVELPDELQAQLEARARALRDVEPGLRSIQAEAIHLTLKFLGAVDRDRIAELSRVLAEVAEGEAPFEAEVVGLGAFPRLDSAQVVWAGARPASNFARLAAHLDEALASLGFVPELRPFHPHITIGRLKGRGRHRALGDALRRSSEEPFGGLRVTAVTLFESFLEPDRARYVSASRGVLGARAGATLA